MRKRISEKEAKASNKEICEDCKHPKNYHIFFNQEKRILELINCNICGCKKFTQKEKPKKEKGE